MLVPAGTPTVAKSIYISMSSIDGEQAKLISHLLSIAQFLGPKTHGMSWDLPWLNVCLSST
jgi:hypothetical protein